MIAITLPGREINLEIRNLVLDVNGTLTLDGQLVAGVEPLLNTLKNSLQVYLLTSDTLGCGARVAEELDIPLFKVGSGGAKDKLDFLNTIGAEESIVIGNGYNDRLIMEHAAIAIIVLGAEGGSAKALQEADIAVTSILTALELVLNPMRIIATLRD